MKILDKRFIPLIAMLLLPMGAWAQPRIARHVDFGVIGGTAMSQFKFDPSVSQNMSIGPTFGVAARYTEEKFFGLQAELLFTQRGWKDRYDMYPELSFERTLNYLEMPIMAHIYFECGQKSEISVDMGPKLGFFLSDKISSNLPSNFGQTDSEYYGYRYKHHSLSVDKKFDYGIQAGLGYEFKLNQRMALQVQGRYYFGLGNIFPDSKSDDFETSRNSTIQIVMALWWKHWVRGHRVIVRKEIF